MTVFDWARCLGLVRGLLVVRPSFGSVEFYEAAAVLDHLLRRPLTKRPKQRAQSNTVKRIHKRRTASPSRRFQLAADEPNEAYMSPDGLHCVSLMPWIANPRVREPRRRLH